MTNGVGLFEGLRNQVMGFIIPASHSLPFVESYIHSILWHDGWFTGNGAFLVMYGAGRLDWHGVRATNKPSSWLGNHLDEVETL